MPPYRAPSPVKSQISRLQSPPLAPRGPRNFTKTSTPPSQPVSRIPSSRSTGGRSPPNVRNDGDRYPDRGGFRGRDFAPFLQRGASSPGSSGPNIAPEAQRYSRRPTSPTQWDNSLSNGHAPPLNYRSPERNPAIDQRAPRELEEGEVTSPGLPIKVDSWRGSNGAVRGQSPQRGRDRRSPQRGGAWRFGRGSNSPVKRPTSRVTSPIPEKESLPWPQAGPNGRRRANSVTGPGDKPFLTSQNANSIPLPERANGYRFSSFSPAKEEPSEGTQPLSPPFDQDMGSPSRTTTMNSRPLTPRSPPPEAVRRASQAKPSLSPEMISQANSQRLLSPEPRPETPDFPPPLSAGLQVQESQHSAPPHDSSKRDGIPEVTVAPMIIQPPKPIPMNPRIDHTPSGQQVANEQQTITPSPRLAQDTFDQLALAASANRITIAERRSVQLPPTRAPLSSPFRDKSPRRDPQPTVESTVETVGTIDADESMDVEDGVPATRRESSTDLSDGAAEEARTLNLVTAIKKAQSKARSPQLDAILEANAETTPARSTRVNHALTSRTLRDEYIEDFTYPLAVRESQVGRLVASRVKQEKVDLQGKIARLRAEYKMLEEEWKEHCEYLEATMEKRGPPPADLYITPGALFPAATPGIPPSMVPTTPGDEMFGSRAARRRGIGDAVTTEAEFQEILAGLADTAAKDPTFRANKTSATIPDMVLDRERLLVYDDENDLVTDPLTFYDFAGKAEPIWTEDERASFLKRYLTYPKQFGKIAEGIPDKSASDCVLYYYRTKKTVDYKNMLASRRGDKKRKPTAFKKTGKSSALLADLDRKKPTVNQTMQQGPKSAISPANSRDALLAKRKQSSKDAISPGLYGPAARRKKMLEDEADAARAANGSSTSKSKMRMTMKTAAKRPRVSSLGDRGPMGMSDSSLAPLTAMDGESATNDLLPPLRRAGKKRKVAEPDDPPQPVSSAEEGALKPHRRSATNSYWSIEEKRKFKDLMRIHGLNMRAIAAELVGKSERQVANYFDAHRQELEFEGETASTPSGDRSSRGLATRRPDQLGPNDLPFPPAHHHAHVGSGDPQTGSSFDRRSYEGPRLGTFPSNQHLVPPPLNAIEDLPRPISRPGGMSLSAMLNDASSDPPSRNGRGYDTMETASDATVSEREGENGMFRPSPRSTIPALPSFREPDRLELAQDQRRSLSSGVHEMRDWTRRTSASRSIAFDPTSITSGTRFESIPANRSLSQDRMMGSAPSTSSNRSPWNHPATAPYPTTRLPSLSREGYTSSTRDSRLAYPPDQAPPSDVQYHHPYAFSDRPNGSPVYGTVPLHRSESPHPFRYGLSPPKSTLSDLRDLPPISHGHPGAEGVEREERHILPPIQGGHLQEPPLPSAR